MSSSSSMSALDITLSLSTSLLVIALVVLGYFYYVARNSAAAPAVCDTASLQQQLADAQSRLQQTNIRCPTCATPAPCPVCPAVPKYKIPISVTDQGYGNSSDATKLKRGYYDAQGQGLPLDYCRYTGASDYSSWNCATAGGSEYQNYDPSLPAFKSGPAFTIN